MKNTYIVFALFISILFLTQCKKSESNAEKQTIITYPITGQFGNNILAMSDSVVINPSLTFSFVANLQVDATLKVIMTNLSTGGKAVWFFDPVSNQNWNISTYNTTLDQQTFSFKIGSSLDLSMTFADTLGKCKIDFFENNSQSPSKSKYLIWHFIKK
jgi:hypothetical protein